ncbi:hypothetical protein CDL12_30517 [Handroanthus impetiginosus]|uniref:Cytochrome b n=1 Tax=Handroanthus impetiginosus TaxID=429701 RepID=A0A2G9FVQ4_9LAMI|nr:hypothetical protein CDL12_30517 [Handroanthus impetiginosus]
MRIFKSHPLISLLNGYLVDSPQPSNLSFCLIIQIVTGVTLAMHYNPSVLEAFNSVEHIMRDVNNGTVIFILMMATAFLGYVLPYAALALMHLIALHDSAGSGNPLGLSGNYDRIPFAPYFIFKDLITIFLFIVLLSVFVFFMPNVLGDSENYVMANPMQTPPAIVPE